MDRLSLETLKRMVSHVLKLDAFVAELTLDRLGSLVLQSVAFLDYKAVLEEGSNRFLFFRVSSLFAVLEYPSKS